MKDKCEDLFYLVLLISLTGFIGALAVYGISSFIYEAISLWYK